MKLQKVLQETTGLLLRKEEQLAACLLRENTILESLDRVQGNLTKALDSKEAIELEFQDLTGAKAQAENDFKEKELMHQRVLLSSQEEYKRLLEEKESELSSLTVEYGKAREALRVALEHEDEVKMMLQAIESQTQLRPRGYDQMSLETSSEAIELLEKEIMLAMDVPRFERTERLVASEMARSRGGRSVEL